MDKQLKPCPFCGAEVEMRDCASNFGTVSVIQCKNEKCKAIFVFDYTKKGVSLYNAWNRRVNNG